MKHEVFRNLVFSQQPGYNDIVYTIDVNKIKTTFTKSLYFCLFDSKEMPFRNKSLGKEDRKVLQNQLEVEYRDILEKRNIQQKEQESNKTEVEKKEVNSISCMDALVYDFILYFIK